MQEKYLLLLMKQEPSSSIDDWLTTKISEALFSTKLSFI